MNSRGPRGELIMRNKQLFRLRSETLVRFGAAPDGAENRVHLHKKLGQTNETEKT